jgi:hypothetical protein
MLKRFFILLVLCMVIVGAASAQVSTYNEAPMLADQVAAGDLPAR